MKPPRNPAESSPSTLEWWSCPGVVYFVAAGDSPYLAIKIGVAAQTGSRDLRSTVRRRLDQIQSSNHEPIQLLGLKYFEETAECAFPMREADAL